MGFRLFKLEGMWLLAGLLLTLQVAVGVTAGGSGAPARLAPQFVAEPPALVRYAAASGARLRCAAVGDPPPTLAWLAEDNSPLEDRPGVRRVFNNGTLEVLPAAEGQPAVLRCRAANAHGVALSREVTLQPVSDTGWEVSVSGGPAAAGGVAALACVATGAGAGLVAPALWYRGDQVIDNHRPSTESRYLVAGDTLLIREVRAADAGPYSCLARHALTAHTRRSKPHTLTVTQGRSSSAPRLAAAGEVTAAAGVPVCLPCASADHPPPHYTWYRESGGRLQPVEASSAAPGGAWAWAGGAALCLPRAAPALAGAWLCKAYNVYGDATAQVRLHVQDTLTVTTTPAVVVADSGSTVRLNCSANDPSARLSWLHDGAAAGVGSELVLRGVARAHRGLYQCVARRPGDNAHADVELRLGDSAPELHYTFIEQALRAGGAVSLRCVAAGAPPPRFQWLLDAQPIDQHRPQHRYFISEETSANGDVVSTLNVSAASAADGGRYTCRAHNALGRAEHSARLNIYGPPSIRALGPVRVVAGANATVFCPYAGYPISSVSWWAREAGRAVGGAGRVSARGAELRLRPALPPDAGHYACAVSAPGGAAARRDIEIQVRNPPKISPFMFSSELTEGSSVQVLCGVSSGDKPMYFSWLKDGAPLPSNLQIEEKSLNEFSLLMFSDLSARHSGDYTCRVSNHAATVNYTATLSVKVAPAWLKEPLDTAVLLGAPLNVECAAKGYPIPTVTWYRKIGDGTSLLPESSEQWQLLESMMWEEKSRSGTHTAVRAQNGTLTAAIASRNHQGLYRCLADNGVGPPLVKHINLTVHEPAHFEESGGNVSSIRGQSASLTCHALGDAPLTVHWTHMGSRLDLSSYRWTVSEVRTADGLRSVLQLRAAERADAGEYRCHAHNQFGRSEVLMYLHVEEPPEAPRSIRLGGVGSRWVRLAWRSGPGPGVYFSALFTALHALPGVESKHISTNLTLESMGNDRLDADGLRSLSARLDGLRPAAAYSLRLIAANHVGQSPHSDPLLFTTLEEPPTASPQNVRVRPASVGELHVSWSAPPQDGWNGELLGYVVSWRELNHFEEEGGEARRAGAATAPGWSSGELAVGGLRSFARYAVIVRAYNRAGAGPPTPTVYATTADGVPEVPPTSVFCEGVSARAVRVRWAQPPPAAAHALRGYQLQYAPLEFSPGAMDAGAGVQTARAGAEGEATLQGLRPATNYSVWVRARADAGLGPPAPPVYCATNDDVPGAPEAIRALPVSGEAVRVSWLPPAERSGRLTHYTLYTRELGKVGGEWSQRVEAEGGAEAGAGEAWREVTGLRERTVYEFWVRASTVAGAGPPSRAVTAAPALPAGVRISSMGRVVWAGAGARVRLRCAAVGAPPLRWRWSPPDPRHTLTEVGDLIIHKAESSMNYTCSVRGGGGADSAQFAVVVRAPPAAPAPRLLRADTHALHLAWDPPHDNGAPLLGYTIWWSEVSETGAEAEARRERRALVAGGEPAPALWLRGLACGALHRVTAQAHNALGDSPRSPPLLARTLGDKAKAAPGKEFVWANSSALRLNLLAWRARCPVAAWAAAVRPAGDRSAWADLPATGESATANNLRPGTWYEIRVVARSAAGNTAALYRAATLTVNGERMGEPVELPLETRGRADVAAGAEAEAGAAWRAGLAPLLMAAGLAALLAAVAGAAVLRRRAAACARSCSPPPRAHPQLYTTEPGKRNGKALTPPDNDLHEISPYATFSMAGGCTGPGAGVGAGAGAVAVAGAGAGTGGCALHLRTFGRAEPLDLAAPPPRPNLLTHGNEYGRGRDSDSESSGSPCAACAAELYRPPAARLADTLPAVESSAEDTSYSACGRGAYAPRPARGVPERSERSERAERERSERGRQSRGRRRRDHARHSSAPTVRYFAAGAPPPRQEVL